MLCHTMSRHVVIKIPVQKYAKGPSGQLSSPFYVLLFGSYTVPS